MAEIKLNHQLVRSLMTELFMDNGDLAKRMKVSKQMASYIIRRGGRKYARPLAKVFHCDWQELLLTAHTIMKLPKGKRMKGSRVSKS